MATLASVLADIATLTASDDDRLSESVYPAKSDRSGSASARTGGQAGSGLR